MPAANSTREFLQATDLLSADYKAWHGYNMLVLPTAFRHLCMDIAWIGQFIYMHTLQADGRRLMYSSVIDVPEQCKDPKPSNESSPVGVLFNGTNLIIAMRQIFFSEATWRGYADQVNNLHPESVNRLYDTDVRQNLIRDVAVHALDVLVAANVIDKPTSVRITQLINQQSASMEVGTLREFLDATDKRSPITQLMWMGPYLNDGGISADSFQTYCADVVSGVQTALSMLMQRGTYGLWGISNLSIIKIKMEDISPVDNEFGHHVKPLPVKLSKLEDSLQLTIYRNSIAARDMGRFLANGADTRIYDYFGHEFTVTGNPSHHLRFECAAVAANCVFKLLGIESVEMQRNSMMAIDAELAKGRIKD